MNEVNIRRAEVSDASVIADHRARMFQEMDLAPRAIFDSLRTTAEHWTAQALEAGEYLGWLAVCGDEIVAGAGVQLRRTAPHPLTINGEIVLAEGRQAIVINVFTQPAWRGRGLGARLMKEILAWARTEKLDRLVLHASAQGRLLYEQLNFVSTNEMRFNGNLKEE
jgi:GNAT superfamily N-acetyltransferase